MEFQIIQVLTAAEVQRFLLEFQTAKFVDGRATASGLAKDVKQNLQVDRSGSDWPILDDIVFSALRRNKEFQLFAQPKRVLPPIYSRYEIGMKYGTHIDGAIMGGANPLRTDLAMTLFLSDPDSYDGGELLIEQPLGEQAIKLAQGEAVVYPATMLHRVEPITRGVRFAVVTWIQCAVRDPRIRAILFDLGTATAKAEAEEDAASLLLLSKCYNNLLRYSMDT